MSVFFRGTTFPATVTRWIRSSRFTSPSSAGDTAPAESCTSLTAPPTTASAARPMTAVGMTAPLLFQRVIEISLVIPVLRQILREREDRSIGPDARVEKVVQSGRKIEKGDLSFAIVGLDVLVAGLLESEKLPVELVDAGIGPESRHQLVDRAFDLEKRD